MKNKDIHEWLLDEGIDPLTTVTTEKGEYYLSDILEKHLTEQLRLFAVSGRSELLLAFAKFIDADCDLLGTGYIEEMVKKFEASNSH